MTFNTKKIAAVAETAGLLTSGLAGYRLAVLLLPLVPMTAPVLGAIAVGGVVVAVGANVAARYLGKPQDKALEQAA